LLHLIPTFPPGETTTSVLPLASLLSDTPPLTWGAHNALQDIQSEAPRLLVPEGTPHHTIGLTNSKNAYQRNLDPPIRLESPDPANPGYARAVYNITTNAYGGNYTVLEEIRAQAGKLPLFDGKGNILNKDGRTKGGSSLRNAYDKGLNVDSLENISEDATEKREKREKREKM
jgi:hypothetical protein